MLLNTQYIVLIIAWLRPVQTGFLRSTNILLRGKTETDEIPNPHEPRPAVRSFPVRSSPVSGFFPVHRTGPRNTNGIIDTHLRGKTSDNTLRFPSGLLYTIY